MSNLVFSKKRMVDRLRSLGLSDSIDDSITKVMDTIDGLPVHTGPNWQNTVYGHDVYMCKSNDGTNIPVSRDDCITLEEWKRDNCS